MNVLVLGGTRFFGVHLVNELLQKGHRVTVASRGRAKPSFAAPVQQILVNRTDPESMKAAFTGKNFDLVYDDLAYCSQDVKILFDAVYADRYLFISSASVYSPAPDLKEEDFDPLDSPVIWCDRQAFPYDEIKRQAERALFQTYSDRNFTAVRFPFGIGKDDYTGRLQSYVEHVLSQTPLFVDNLKEPLAFIQSEEAGKFLAFLSDHPYQGAINAASKGTASAQDIFSYLKEKTGKSPVLSPSGQPAPYNGSAGHSLNTSRAEAMGFSFLPLDSYFYSLLDFYIKEWNK